MTTLYKYLGSGDALYHVPARDLTDEDFAERAELWRENGITEAVIEGCGLYEKVGQVETEPKKKSKRGVFNAVEEGE